MFERIRQFLRDNPRLPLVVGVAVLVGVFVVWGVWGGFSLEIGQFFAAEPAANSDECPVTPGGNTVTVPVLSVQCGATSNVLTWTDTESIEGVRVQLQRNSYDTSGVAVEGGNLTDEVGCTGTFRVNSFVDTTAPADLTNNYVIKVGGRQNMWSQELASCPPRSPAPAPAAAQSVTDATSTTTGSSVAVTAAPTAAPATVAKAATVETSGSCAQYYREVAKCYKVHSCGSGRSDSVCGETFVTNDSPGEIGYGVYYGFEDVYKAPDGTVYWFNWRTKSPPENDPTTWTWAKIPSNPQAWCTSPAQGIVSVQAPTTDLHKIFDAQAQAGRFGCAVAKVGAYNNSKNDEGIDCPAAEKKFYACRAALNDLVATPVPTPVPTPTPTPFEEPPVAAGVTCTPGTQTVILGQTGSFQAFGGDGVYRWDGGAGAIQEESTGEPGAAAFGWTAAGRKLVTVTSGGETGTCTAVVQSPGSAVAEAPIALVKSLRNETAGQTVFREALEIRTNQRIQFMLRITDRKGGGSGDIRIRDTVPPGMTYMPDSTVVDGSPVGDGIVSGGITISPLAPRGEHTVLWFAVADRLGQLRVGPQTARPEALLQTDNNGASIVVSAAVTVTLFGTASGATGTAGGPGVIPTGPGGATLISLVLAAVGSLLYAAHTRSPGFRRGEVQQLGRDQGPMDFRI